MMETGSKLARPTMLAATLVLCACGGDGGGTAPDPRAVLVGVWTMVAANGNPLPLAETPFPGDQATSVTGGGIRFATVANGNTLRFCRRHEPLASNPPPYTEAVHESFVYEVVGNEVRITYQEGARAFVAPDTGIVSGSQLTIRRRFETDGRVYTFQKTSDDPAPGGLPGCLSASPPLKNGNRLGVR